MNAVRKCGANGGTGIGAGHVCICNAPLGHEPIYGRGHGCSCGAVWADRDINPGGESAEVREARAVVATADPEILAAAKVLAAPGDWEELNIMRQSQFVSIAWTVVRAAHGVVFSRERIAETVAVTGISLQTVTEVARELMRA